LVTETKTLEIEGVRVLFQRSKRAKRISVSVAPFHGVRVSVPYSSSYSQAEGFIRLKMGWIKRHLEKIRSYESVALSIKKRDSADGIDKGAAREKIKARLALLAKKYGFSYDHITIRNQKTRWGSCSVKNNISLNINLTSLPEELMDYVILHELVHTRIKDHSPRFWAEMDKLTGDGRRMRRRLKNHTGLLCL
jgi:predicted metal-dependent hydrolase